MIFRLFSAVLLSLSLIHVIGRADEPTETAPSTGEMQHVFVRWLPDIKQLLTEPDTPLTTTIDIGKTYRKHPDFENVSPVFELLEKGKSKVVEATIQENQLVLQWKQVGSSEISIRTSNPETNKIYNEKVRLEAWMPDYLTTILTVIGGLGLFLVGMKLMSEGLQIVAGAGLRRMIATLTNNRIAATAVGLLVTSIIQSSSVTTVMVVGFINSQIMTLSQGIGVIMGANIGTTMTAWILAFSLGKYGLPILGLAAFFYLFSKNEKIRFIGMAIMGLGMVFVGLELMMQGFKPLRDLPSFTAWMETFSADSYVGVMGCVAVGCLLTLIVQSSSATIGITISLAAIGVIGFETAAALVLGENIGTTITAILASIGTSANARRAAYFHTLFNTIGVFYVTLFFVPYIALIKYLIGVDPATGVVLDAPKAVALTHTMFNVFNTIVFLPFTPLCAKLLIRFVPDSAKAPAEPRLTKLNAGIVKPTALAIEQSRTEVLRMGNTCDRLAQNVLHILKSETPDTKMVENSVNDEDILDKLHDEIIEFTSSMLSGNISNGIAEHARQQLRMADELESISDYIVDILESDLKLRKSDLALPEPEKSELLEVHAALNEMVKMIVRHFAERKTSKTLLTDVRTQGRDLNEKVKGIRNRFFLRMSEEKFDPQVVIAFNKQLNAYRRVREHARNVAAVMVDVR